MAAAPWVRGRTARIFERLARAARAVLPAMLFMSFFRVEAEAKRSRVDVVFF